MDFKDFRNLQEAYLEIYQVHESEQIDEISADLALRASREASSRAGTYASLSGGERKPTERAKKLRAQAERLYTAQARKRLKAKTTPVSVTKEEFVSIFYYLLDEGYAETLESAKVIIMNMSEEWRDEIVEGYKDLPVDRMKSQAKSKMDKAWGGRFDKSKIKKSAKQVRSMAKVADKHGDSKSSKELKNISRGRIRLD